MNCDILKIVSGNDFSTQMTITALDAAGNVIENFSLEDSTDVVVKYTLAGESHIIEAYDYDIEGNDITIQWSDLSLGKYGFEIEGKFNGYSWRSAARFIFQIVADNASANIPDGVLVDGVYKLNDWLRLLSGTGGGGKQVQANWDETDTKSPAYIQNKPNLELKADKVSGAVVGDFAGLDANGNLTDSGKKASDFATAEQGAKADTAIQEVKTINNQSIVGAGNIEVGGAVESVNGQIGEVVLDAEDVGAATAEQVQDLADDVAILQAAYAGLTQSDIVIGTLPASGEANTIYRVPSTSSYSDYMWDGSQFVLMATYDGALEDTEDILLKIGKTEVLFNYEKSYYGVTQVGQTVDVTSPSSNNGYRCLFSAISAGDSVFVTGKGGSSARLWAFLDSTYTVLSIAGVNVTENNVEHIAPTNSAYFIIDDNNTGGKIYKQYKTSIDTQFAELTKTYGDEVNYKEYTDIQKGIQYSGHTIGEALTKSSVSASRYIRIPVSLGDSFILNSNYSSASGTRTWYFVNHYNDEDVCVSYADTGLEEANKLLVAPKGANILIVQGSENNTFTIRKLGCSPQIEKINKSIVSLRDFDDLALPNFKGKCRYLETSLALTHFGEHFTNIGFIGDSWTEGKYSGGYTKQIALILQEKYGYGGLGWLDLTRETGVGSASIIYGAALESTGYSVTLINGSGITTLDGSSGTEVAAQCLGPCCAHSVFANESGYSLTFDEGVLDRFNILYYKDAHFTVSVNGGTPVEITANSSDRLQSREFTDANGITSVEIVSLANGSVIFGMDCFFGTSGVRVHKFGNGSISADEFWAMNEDQFKDEMAHFDMCWVLLAFTLNDMGSSRNPYRAEEVNTNINNLAERVRNAYGQAPTIDTNLLNIYSVTSDSFPGVYLLYQPQRESAIDAGWGFISTKQVLGEPLISSLFSGDGVHLNQYGWYVLAKAINKVFFE